MSTRLPFSSFSSLLAGCALALVLAPACGDDGLGSNTDAGEDLSATTDGPIGDLAGKDFASKPGFDLAGADFGGILCGTQTCGAGNICCLVPDFQGQSVTAMCSAASSCGDGGIPAACDGPEDCSSGTPDCCIALALGGGGMSASGGASCTASCPGSASQTGLNTKLCHGPSDCANYNGTAPIVGNAPFDKCCGTAGLSFRFCAPGLITLVSSMITCD